MNDQAIVTVCAEFEKKLKEKNDDDVGQSVGFCCFGGEMLLYSCKMKFHFSFGFFLFSLEIVSDCFLEYNGYLFCIPFSLCPSVVLLSLDFFQSIETINRVGESINTESASHHCLLPL